MASVVHAHHHQRHSHLHAHSRRYLDRRRRHRPRSQQILERLLQSHLLAKPAAAHRRLHLAGRHLGAHHLQPHRRRQAARPQDQHGAAGASSGSFLPSSPRRSCWCGISSWSRSRSVLCSRWASTPSPTGPSPRSRASRSSSSSPRPPSSAWPTTSPIGTPSTSISPTPVGVLLLALIATGSGEYAREMLRKPYVIGRWMYSNGTPSYLCQPDQHGRLPGPFAVGLEWESAPPLPQATRAAKPSSAANAARATPCPATGL